MARSRKRGLSLGTVLVVASLMLVMAFSLAALSTSHLNFAQSYANRQEARALAEAALAETYAAIDEALREGRDFDGSDGPYRVVRDEERWGVVDFDDPEHPSTADFKAGRKKSGVGHLWAVGHCRGEVEEIQVALNVPPFPYALAANGVVEAGANGFEVRPLSGGGSRSAHLRGNADVKGGEKSRVLGDALAVGAIDLKPEAVDGRMLPGSAAVDLPEIDLTQYDPRHPSIGFVEEEIVTVEPTVNEDLTVYGPARTLPEENRGSLRVTRNLYLRRGLLYVEGDLHVEGGVFGEGAVVVRGHTTLKGDVGLTGRPGSGQERVALLCGGNVNLGPSRPLDAAPFFQGLVYTRGDFRAHRVRVAGAFVMAPSPGGGAQSMYLDEVRLEYESPAATLQVQVDKPGFSANDLLYLGNSLMMRGSPVSTDPAVRAEWSEAKERLDETKNQVMAGVPFQTSRFFHSPTFSEEAISAFDLMLVGWETKLTNTDDEALGHVSDILARARDMGMPAGVPLRLEVAVFRKEISHPNVAASEEAFHILPPNGESEGQFRFAAGERGQLYYQGQISFLGPGKYSIPGHKHENNPANPDMDWIGISRSHIERIAEIYGLNIHDFGHKSVQLQEAMKETANQILTRNGRRKASESTSKTVDLDLSQFLSDSLPLRVTGWRNR